MFLWNVDGLARALKAGEVSEKQKSYYFVAFILLMIACMTLYRMVPAPPCIAKERTVIDLLSGIIYGCISLYGIMHAFYINQAGDGKQFIERFICLSVPIALRIIAYFLLLAIPVGIVRAFIPLQRMWGTGLPAATVDGARFTLTSCFASWVGLLIVSLLLIWLFMWLWRKIAYASGTPNDIKIKYVFVEYFINRK